MLLQSLTELPIALLLTVNTLKSLYYQLLRYCEPMADHRLTLFIFQTLCFFVFEFDYI